MIEELTRTSDSYEEAIKCLNELYDRPRYVLEGHIRSIVDAAPVKNGSEKEFRRLCDAVTQHYRTLKAAKADSFETLLTGAAPTVRLVRPWPDHFLFFAIFKW